MTLATCSFTRDAEELRNNISRVMVGKEGVIHNILACFFAEGHVLLRDLPGVGKTLMARSLASSVSGVFKRVQFTPDLLPSDITGSSIYNQGEGKFQFVPGPVFANILLADEINRASPRTQSALLEAMAERQATVDGISYQLPQPFWVIATQNEVDGYGTFPLPHAQLDRFMMSLSMGYPSVEEQVAILQRNENQLPQVHAVLDTARVEEMQREVRTTRVAPPVREYIARVLMATRNHPDLTLGASPRAGVHLQRAAQVSAALRSSSFVTPEDVKSLAVPVLAHRMVLSSSGAKPLEQTVREILEDVPVPV